MKILITGSLGFIATNLILALSERDGVSIVGIDNRSSLSSNLCYTKELCEHHFFDLQDRELLESSLKNVDVVVHLAAKGNVVESIEDPILNFTSNVSSTLSLLESMRVSNVSRIVFSSTGGALMGNTLPPVNESSIPAPISPYGASKLSCEAYLSAYSEAYSFNSIALRFGNVYGKYSLHKSGVINKWIDACFSGDSLVIYGDGSSTRDYIHVSDLVDGIVAAICRISTLPRPCFEKYHLANSSEISLNRLKKIIESIHGFDLSCSYLPARKGEVNRNFADTTLAADCLGFSPRVTFVDGLSDLYSWISGLQ